MTAPQWNVGDRIENRWEIHKILRGGMGVVYIVFDHELRQPFAMKTYQDEVFARSPGVAEGFRREALTWVNLDVHANITQAYGVETIAGKPFLILELIGGGDLGAWIGTPRLVGNLPQVLRFAIQLCDGMVHAGSKGMRAHRDLKPQNCLIAEDGTLKITDFGLAKVLDEIGPAETRQEMRSAEAGSFSRTGTAAGTPLYMAPEQFDDAKHVDARADVYATGIMLYEMVTGRRPFVAPTWQEVKRLHKTQAPPRLDGGDPNLEGITLRCLSKDPGQRFDGFVELRGALAHAYRGVTGKDPPRPVDGAQLDAVRWGLKGVNLSRLGRIPESLLCLDRALEINPGLAQLWVNKGTILAATGQYEEAILSCDRGLSIDPKSEHAWFSKGCALMGMGKNELALQCCDRALAIDPEYEGAHHLRAKICARLDRIPDAIASYELAVRLNSRDPQMWFELGALLPSVERFEDALLCFQATLELDPAHVQALYFQGMGFAVLGQMDQALASMQAAAKLGHPDAPQAIRQFKETLNSPE
jgi:tetratricopeptide (TPR) repeat protein